MGLNIISPDGKPARLGGLGTPGKPGDHGKDGGYYTPDVEQVDENTVRMRFTPSKEDMPEVDAAEITLPESTGKPGKSAYEYAVEGGYTGTEEEFAKKLAKGYSGVTVQDYGAKGDGVTDDTAAFQAALAENRVVFVPGDTYLLSDEIKIGNNSTLELQRDVVLDFTQTEGNCITLGMFASLRGNRATVCVPYAFSGKVVNADTADTVQDDIYTMHPWRKWDPMWKYARYVTDLNITKADSRGFHYYYPEQGPVAGTAVFIRADGTDDTHYMWGLHYSGLRIAGAFSYGARALCENEGWLHELRLDAFMTGCEIGVSLENTNNAYVSAIVQPSNGLSADGTTHVIYAKHGIQLINSQNADLSGSRVWDWDANGTLWTPGGEYQHIAMRGDCKGAILNDFLYYWQSSYDIRDLIYTDTPSNLEKLTILQEPFTRWFKPVNSAPYFFNGIVEKPLMLHEHMAEFFTTDRVKGYTDALATAIDTSGSVFNGIGYDKHGGALNSVNEVVADTAAWYGHTGYIACKKGDVIYVKDILIADGDGYTKAFLFDANFNLLGQNNTSFIVSGGGSVCFTGTAAEDGGTLTPIADGAAYMRLGFKSVLMGSDPIISVNKEIKYEQRGFLSDGINVKGDTVVMTSPNGTQFRLSVADDGTVTSTAVE